MHYLRRLLFLIIPSFLITGCNGENSADDVESKPLPTAWWASVPPIMIKGDAFYGQPCSITRVSDVSGFNSESVIFTAPSRLLTYCKDRDESRNYLDYDGTHIILNVERQTVGAGSSTGERYRSRDFESWEEYIGVTWKDGEEYEAWRALGSTSSKADSRKKVVKE